MSIGVVPGKYRMPHNGHEWLIQQGAKKYDKLYVVAAQITEQSPFSLEERLELLRGITEPFENIEVDSLGRHQFLVDYANDKDAEYILRSLRNEEDFRRERNMESYNRKINPEITTEYLIPDEPFLELNSTRLIELLSLEMGVERVRQFVPEIVYQKLLEKNF